jgi:hypothetical protein
MRAAYLSLFRLSLRVRFRHCAPARRRATSGLSALSTALFCLPVLQNIFGAYNQMRALPRCGSGTLRCSSCSATWRLARISVVIVARGDRTTWRVQHEWARRR